MQDFTYLKFNSASITYRCTTNGGLTVCSKSKLPTIRCKKKKKLSPVCFTPNERCHNRVEPRG